MIGTSTADATSAKCFATASELIFGIRGGLIITAAAPADFARRVYSIQVRRPSAVVPATTGTRPLTDASTASSTRSRSGSVSRAISLVTPSAVNPLTPSARNRSMTRARLSRSSSPEGSKGVGRTEKTPPNNVGGIRLEHSILHDGGGRAYGRTSARRRAHDSRCRRDRLHPARGGAALRHRVSERSARVRARPFRRRVDASASAEARGGGADLSLDRALHRPRRQDRAGSTRQLSRRRARRDRLVGRHADP